MNHLWLMKYWSSNSILHKMDPRAKVLFVLGFILLVFFVNDMTRFGIMISYLLFGLSLSKIPLRHYINTLKPILFLILFVFIVHLFFTKDGAILFHVSFITVYENGLILASIISLRILLIASIMILFTFTTSPSEMNMAMERLFKPLKLIRIPIDQLVLMFSIALRFIPTIGEELDRIKKAQMARGIDFQHPQLFKRVTPYVSILIPLLTSIFRRAEELAMAMESRGYQVGMKRTQLKQLSFQWIDGVLVLLFLLLVLFIFVKVC